MGSKILNWLGTILFFLIVAAVAMLPLEEDGETTFSGAAADPSAILEQWQQEAAPAGGTTAVLPAWMQEEAEAEEEQTVTSEPAALVFASESVPSPAPTPAPTPQTADPDYILNLNTGKFHYPSCESVDQMNESNKLPFSGSRDQVVQRGYSPCQKCQP